MDFRQKHGVSTNVHRDFRIFQKLRFLPGRKKLFLQSPSRPEFLLGGSKMRVPNGHFLPAPADKFKKSRKPRKKRKSAHRVTEGNRRPPWFCAIQILNKFFFTGKSHLPILYLAFYIAAYLERTSLA